MELHINANSQVTTMLDKWVKAEELKKRVMLVLLQKITKRKRTGTDSHDDTALRQSNTKSEN